MGKGRVGVEGGGHDQLWGGAPSWARSCRHQCPPASPSGAFGTLKWGREWGLEPGSEERGLGSGSRETERGCPRPPAAGRGAELAPTGGSEAPPLGSEWVAGRAEHRPVQSPRDSAPPPQQEGQAARARFPSPPRLNVPLSLLVPGKGPARPGAKTDAKDPRPSQQGRAVSLFSPTRPAAAVDSGSGVPLPRAPPRAKASPTPHPFQGHDVLSI